MATDEIRNEWGLTEGEEAIAEVYRETIVVFAGTLIRLAGEEAAAKCFRELAESNIRKLKAAGLLRKGFQDFANGILMTTPRFHQELHWDIPNKRLRITKCGLLEAAKRLGYEDTPVSILCKATSDAYLDEMVPGYKKTIIKRMCIGDDECLMTYAKEE